ncbi:DUF2299 family protein [Methanobrevibacter acididurans]|jgi:hypothetical protein|uniref:DUF2299 family protein n=1 Tax=Methanobrevibacter TaxID=2172 RepID=UPI0038FD1F60
MIDKDLIQKWLADEGMFKREIPDDGADFHFIVNFPENQGMDLVKPKGKELILILCATNVDSGQMDLIKAASDSVKQDFIWDLRFTLNNLLLDFNLNHPNDVLEQFIITDDIFDDGLTKHVLMKTIKKVFKGKLNVIWKLEKTFLNTNGNVKPSDDSMFA